MLVFEHLPAIAIKGDLEVRRQSELTRRYASDTIPIGRCPEFELSRAAHLIVVRNDPDCRMRDKVNGTQFRITDEGLKRIRTFALRRPRGGGPRQTQDSSDYGNEADAEHPPVRVHWCLPKSRLRLRSVARGAHQNFGATV